MKAIILAAGRGTRISQHIGHAPKCLIGVYGVPLISYTVDLLHSRGIQEIAVVTGYGAELVEKALPSNVQVFRNPFFLVTNSIASFWLARDFVTPGESLLAMNGDVFMEEALLGRILDEGAEEGLATMVADSTRIEGADYKFRWRDGRLERFGKDLTTQETSGEYVGLGLIPQRHVGEVMSAVQREVMLGNYNKWWEEAIYMQVAYGRNVRVMDVAGHFWTELDLIEDLMRLREHTRSGDALVAD